MARNTTLVKLLDDLRAEARLSLNPGHNTDDRLPQIKLLQKHQQRLWEDFRWPHLRVTRQLPLQIGQRYYSPPSDMIVDNIERIDIFRDSGWVEMRGGINPTLYSTYNSDLNERSWPPSHWDIYEGEQIEIWPVPDQNADLTTNDGVIQFTGIRNLRPLVADSDTCDLDDTMLVAFAAADILAAGGAKDAQLKLDFANDRYRKMTGRLTVKTQTRMFGIGEPTGTRRISINRYRPPVIY